jgi:hypothetical protein
LRPRQQVGSQWINPRTIHLDEHDKRILNRFAI